MGRPLAEFNGDRIYLDTNVLVGLLDRTSAYHGPCDAFFRRATQANPPIRLVTAVLTMDELVFVLLQELLARDPYGVSQSRSRYLSDHPSVVCDLMQQIAPLCQPLESLVTWVAVTPDDVWFMQETMTETGMLPRDAIHFAVLSRLGIPAIASDDEIFDQTAVERFYP